MNTRRFLLIPDTNTSTFELYLYQYLDIESYQYRYWNLILTPEEIYIDTRSFLVSVKHERKSYYFVRDLVKDWQNMYFLY